MDISASQAIPPVLITKVEAARLIGVSRHTIMRAVQRGALQEIRLAPGMRPRLRLDDVLALAQGVKEQDR